MLLCKLKHKHAHTATRYSINEWDSFSWMFNVCCLLFTHILKVHFKRRLMFVSLKQKIIFFDFDQHGTYGVRLPPPSTSSCCNVKQNGTKCIRDWDQMSRNNPRDLVIEWKNIKRLCVGLCANVRVHFSSVDVGTDTRSTQLYAMICGAPNGIGRKST